MNDTKICKYMKIKTLLIAFTLIVSIMALQAQNQSDTTKATKKADKVKKGWNFGGLPVLAYDSDIGFKYGALINVFNYGDGSRYPKYDHSLYFEWSRTTKGSGINQFTYDSERLIPGIRVSAEASLLTEQSLDFYGFNGYESYYNAAYEDDKNPEYISRMFYNQERRLTRVKADFQGKITGPKFRWFAGIEYNHAKMATVDIAKLNKGKDTEDQLPDTALAF